MIDPDGPDSVDSAVGAVVEAFLGRFRRGERPSLPELMARHPEMAEQLQEIIPALVELEHVGGYSGTFSRPGAVSTGATEANHPESLGDYKVLRRIGSGGMGVVYEAEHQSLKSRVALKLMHPRLRDDKKFLRRFHIEARLAAGLHHTNIVSVFDYGEQGGVCYYAMQFIKGQPLDHVLKDLRQLRLDGRNSKTRLPRDAQSPTAPRTLQSVAESLTTGRFVAHAPADFVLAETGPIEVTPAIPNRSTEGPTGEEPGTPRESPTFVSSSLSGPAEGQYYKEVAKLCAKVADALEYAHRASVVHRDIKPSNLLLDDSGNVWVTDFGLARLVNGEDVSQSQDLAGTLRYMAPERFRGISKEGGDIYAMGATLYELATLRPAFDEPDQLRLIDRIAHHPPEHPRLIDRQIPRDLETIILKALAKDPKDRYRSAKDMAEELRLFVAGYPIGSRPISGIERFYRWCKRNPGLAAASIAAAATTIALAISSTIAAKVFYDGREQSQAYAKELAKSETRAREKLFDARTAQARSSRLSRRVGQRFESLAAISEAVRIGRDLGFSDDRFDVLRDEAIACLMLPDMKPAGPPIYRPDTSLDLFAFDEGMTRYAIRFLDGTILVRRWDDNQEIARFADRGDRDIWPFIMSPDGRYLASRNGDTISVWDADRNSLAWTVPEGCKSSAAGFSPDSNRIAVAPRDGTVLVHDLATGQSRSWDGPSEVRSLAFRPDGAEIAVVYSGAPATCRILDASTGRQILELSISDGWKIAWSQDGATLAIVDGQKLIRFFSASSGERGATLELPLSARGGLNIGFHPAGTLLAANSWQSRLRLADPTSGRERLSFPCAGGTKFSKDGRIIVQQNNEYRPWQMDPGIEFTTLSHVSDPPLNHARASIHPDGRILSVGTDRGVILWDLARKTELGFLPIGLAWHSMFEPSGELITNGSAGVLRWAIRCDPASGEIRIGPPRALPLVGSDCGIDTDRTGKIVAVAGHWDARVSWGDQTIKIGPLDDCRGVSLSPDGKLLSTWTFPRFESTIWSLPDGAMVKRLPIESTGALVFSPDGKKCIVSSNSISRLLDVQSRREVWKIECAFQYFSPDGRLGIFQDQGNVLKLVEIETGRQLAQFERPDLQSRSWAVLSPDGSRLVGTLNDPPSTQVIELRLIRRQLASMGLDWVAPAFSVVDPARSDLPPLPPLKVDYGFLTPHLEDHSDSPESLVARYTERIKRNPDDFDAYHHRAHALLSLNRPAEAIDDLSRAILLHPNDAHLLHLRAQVYARAFKKLEPAIADLESALKVDPSRSSVRELLAECCNSLAWLMATNTPSSFDLDRALKLSSRAVELIPGQQMSLNTRGVVLYRAGQYAEAVPILEKSLEAGLGQFDGFDLFFLAMSHHRLGHRGEARRCCDRAIKWVGRHSSLSAEYVKELAQFRAEAEAVLAGPTGELPDDVFERPKPRDQTSRP